ncbi:MAG: polysaccharide pyruvyl transferase family protein [Lachnospiraceae bacterium]
MIGVLTLHNATNYGAVLQTYALQHKLDELGIENEVIWYECPKITEQHRIRKKWWNPLGYEIKKRTQKKFQSFFSNNIRHSDRIQGLQPFTGYDAYLVGSDQVWNMHLTGNDVTFFFEKMPPGVPKYSYAASMGNYRFTDDELQKRCFSCLEEFAGISVREQSLAEYLNDEMVHKAERNIEVHPDPVLLLEREEWEKKAKHTQKGNYVLLYMIKRDYKLIQRAQSISKKMGIPVIWISDSLRHYRYIKNRRCCSPEEFLGLFADSTYIVTNSFHGTAFSLLFQKPFVTVAFQEGKRVERIADLLDTVDLMSRYDDDKTEEMTDDVYWNEVGKKLSLMKEKAARYLKKMEQFNALC